MANSSRDRTKLDITRSKLRSALTNNPGSLQDIDGRSAVARRFRDILSAHVSDLGGPDAGLSEGQLSMARRAAALTVELEILESRFAEGGGAKPAELEVYQRVCNSLRRILESLDIHRGRRARNVVPNIEEYLNGGRGRTIDHDADEDAA